MRLRYRNKITLDKTKLGTFKITTDLADEYETAWTNTRSATPWGEWKEKQHLSDLRQTQLDWFRTLATTLFNDLKPLMVYKRNNGFSQPHDIAVAYSDQDSVWVFMTESHTWITQSAYANFTLNVAEAFGPITNKDTVEELWKLIE